MLELFADRIKGSNYGKQRASTFGAL